MKPNPPVALIALLSRSLCSEYREWSLVSDSVNPFVQKRDPESERVARSVFVLVMREWIAYGSHCTLVIVALTCHDMPGSATTVRSAGADVDSPNCQCHRQEGARLGALLAIARIYE
jgi:hypothetical protein